MERKKVIGAYQDNLNLDKSNRVIAMLFRVINGEVLIKKEIANEYQVSERTIERDLNTLKTTCEDNQYGELIYDKNFGGYLLSFDDEVRLTNEEVLAVSKILMDSRAFPKEEMEKILSKILRQAYPNVNYELAKKLINNEMFHYIELGHKKSILDKIWDIGVAKENQSKLEIVYNRQDGNQVVRIVNPVGIMFSEFYFYLLSFIDNIDKEKAYENKNDPYPTIYRIDRIEKIKLTKEHFKVFKDKFEEGKFRKRTQFMWGGKLKKIKFKYYGWALEYLLDKMPTAEVIEETEDYYLIKAEIFGKGVDFWIKSQGDDIEIIEEKEL